MSQVHLLKPPYSRLAEMTAMPPPPGSAFVVALQNRADHLAESLLRHRNALWCPVCFALEPDSPAEPYVDGLAPYAGAFAKVRVGPCGELPSIDRLVTALRARPRPDGAVLGTWVALRLNCPAAQELIEQSCATYPRSDASRGVPDRTLRHHAKAWGLPSPTRWRVMLELIRWLADPNRKSAWRIDELGGHYGVQSATLRRRIRQFTGLRPSAAIKLLGWEWVAERALGSAGADRLVDIGARDNVISAISRANVVDCSQFVT